MITSLKLVLDTVLTVSILCVFKNVQQNVLNTVYSLFSELGMMVKAFLGDGI